MNEIYHVDINLIFTNVVKNLLLDLTLKENEWRLLLGAERELNSGVRNSKVIGKLHKSLKPLAEENLLSEKGREFYSKLIVASCPGN